MAKFSIAFTNTMSNEGGWGCDPADAGGETYRGISRRYWPAWGGWMIIDAEKAVMKGSGVPVTAENMNKRLGTNAPLQAQVERFYQENFWNRVWGDAITQQELATELFDDAVNMDPVDAVRFLQEGLNLLNRGAKNYQDLQVDGKLGPKTLEMVGLLTKTDGEAKGLRYLMLTINGLQREHYFNNCRRNPGQEKFLRGWLERTV